MVVLNLGPIHHNPAKRNVVKLHEIKITKYFADCKTDIKYNIEIECSAEDTGMLVLKGHKETFPSQLVSTS